LVISRPRRSALTIVTAADGRTRASRRGSACTGGPSLARDQRGALAVEFAIVLPLLLLIVIGAIEFGRVYSQFQVFNGAAREGARCAAVQATPYGDCVVQTRIDDAAAPYEPDEDATVTVGDPAAPSSPVCTDDTVGEAVRVAWDQSFDLRIPFWGDATFTREIEATFRCE
jgi:Flp pilus assembly protein TadG